MMMTIRGGGRRHSCCWVLLLVVLEKKPRGVALSFDSVSLPALSFLCDCLLLSLSDGCTMRVALRSAF